MNNNLFRQAQNLTILMLFKQLTWGSGNPEFISGFSTLDVVLAQTGFSSQIKGYAGGGLVSANGAGELNTYNALLAEFNSANALDMTMNGGGTVHAAGPGTSGFTTGITIGATQGGASLWTNFELQELLIYSGLPFASNKTPAFNYAAQKQIFRVWSRQFLADGDSITTGLNLPASQAWPVVMMSSLSAMYGIAKNVAVAGHQITDCNTLAPSDGMDNYLEKSFDTDIVAIFAGTNDINLGASDATVESRLSTYITGRQSAATAAGATVRFIVFTILSRNFPTDVNGTAAAKEAFRAAYNTWIRNPTNLASLGANVYLADVADSVMGQPTSWQNTTYFQGDGIHPTQAGQQHIASIVAAVVSGNGL